MKQSPADLSSFKLHSQTQTKPNFSGFQMFTQKSNKTSKKYAGVIENKT